MIELSVVNFFKQSSIFLLLLYNFGRFVQWWFFGLLPWHI